MISRVQAYNYRALRYIDQTLNNFQILIGPNASGKSTFLDSIALMADIIHEPDLNQIIQSRTDDFHDLLWLKQGTRFELAIEAPIPREFESSYRHVRYEIGIGLSQEKNTLIFTGEILWLTSDTGKKTDPVNFPLPLPANDSFMLVSSRSRKPQGWRKVVEKKLEGNDYFRSEKTEWNNLFRLSPNRSALANLPEDEDRFPIATWFKRYISQGVQKIQLNSEAMRLASRPQSPRTFLPDGSNLPQVIHLLETSYPEQLVKWVLHLRTALPDLKYIRTIESPDTRYRHLVIGYSSGYDAPSWTLSDGTLRMLALTLLAYLPDLQGIYLIEEPENGIHPTAVETVFQSLSSIYNAQVLLATHSPVVLQLAQPNQLLCFARRGDEAAIVSGDLHPYLKDGHQINLASLFASGILS